MHTLLKLACEFSCDAFFTSYRKFQLQWESLNRFIFSSHLASPPQRRWWALRIWVKRRVEPCGFGSMFLLMSVLQVSAPRATIRLESGN